MPEIIRSEDATDRAAVGKLNEVAFGGNAESNLVDALREGELVEVSLVAELDATVVGHILFSRVVIQTQTGSLDALCLAPMSVLPNYQRQGLGTKLVLAGLDACRQQGQRIVVVLGHPAFYRRFGFSAELARSLDSPFGGGDAWMALELEAGALAGIRGRVEFSRPFSALE